LPNAILSDLANWAASSAFGESYDFMKFRKVARGMQLPGQPREAAAILAKIPEKSVLVALDERGDSIDSAAFCPASWALAR